MNEKDFIDRHTVFPVAEGDCVVVLFDGAIRYSIHTEPEGLSITEYPGGMTFTRFSVVGAVAQFMSLARGDWAQRAPEAGYNSLIATWVSRVVLPMIALIQE